MADLPKSPWSPVTDETPPPPRFSSIGKEVSWILQQCSSVYRALWPAVSPREADELELWQIAALAEPDTSNMSDEEINRLLIEERYKAARAGRELDPDEIFSGMSESQVTRVGTAQSQATDMV